MDGKFSLIEDEYGMWHVYWKCGEGAWHEIGSFTAETVGLEFPMYEPQVRFETWEAYQARLREGV